MRPSCTTARTTNGAFWRTSPGATRTRRTSSRWRASTCRRTTRRSPPCRRRATRSAFSRLTSSVNALGNALEAADLSEEDKTRCTEIVADYNSNADFINRSDYNTEAAKFNEILRTTPARGLAELVGIEPLELFQ